MDLEGEASSELVGQSMAALILVMYLGSSGLLEEGAGWFNDVTPWLDRGRTCRGASVAWSSSEVKTVADVGVDLAGEEGRRDT